MPPATFEEVASRVDRYWTIIDRVAQRYQVSQSLIQAVIHQESGGDPRAYREEKSIGDASYGLMQLLRRTAQAVAGKRLTVEDLYNPRINIDLGTRYLATLHHYYNDWVLALIGYNGGPRAVTRFRQGDTLHPAVRYAAKVVALQARYKAWNKAKGRVK